jgi:hypothetical protein
MLDMMVYYLLELSEAWDESNHVAGKPTFPIGPLLVPPKIALLGVQKSNILRNGIESKLE